MLVVHLFIFTDCLRCMLQIKQFWYSEYLLVNMRIHTNVQAHQFYEMLEIHSLFYSCWILDCEHWIGDVKENSCGISVLNFTSGELCTQSCVSVCVDLCYCALNTISCNNWKWWNIIHTYYNMWFLDAPRAFRIWGVIVLSVTWNSTLLYQHNTLKHSLYQPTCVLNKIQFMTGIELPTCFGIGLPSSRSLLEQRNMSPTCKTRYCTAITGMIKILKV